MKRSSRCSAAAGLLLLAAPLSTFAAGEGIVRESFLVPSKDPGIQLYVRNKHLAGRESFPSDRIVLFVHGATYPSEAVFDLDLPGGSWMDYAAARGFDAWLVDVRGYGGSTRPPAMDAPPESNPAFATTADASRDVEAAIDFILGRRRAGRLSLVGWSWGTTLVAGYAADQPDRIEKLVLYAPVWILKGAPPVAGSGAYRSVQKEAVRQRGLRGIPKERVEDVSPTLWFDQFWTALQSTDPAGAKQKPPVVRAPNGVIRDLMQDHWAAGKPTYDPARVRAPTLVVLAEWDQDTPLYMAQELYAKLANAPHKRLVVLAEGTHTAALERNRMQLVREVQAFLEEPAPAAPAAPASKSAARVVQDQLDAYNVQDLDAFAATYSDDVEVAVASTGQVRLKGRQALREWYGEMFRKFPKCYCRIAERRTEGERVVLDHEIITGRGPDKPDPWDVGWVRYEVEGGLIRRVTLP